MFSPRAFLCLLIMVAKLKYKNLAALSSLNVKMMANLPSKAANLNVLNFMKTLSLHLPVHVINHTIH